VNRKASAIPRRTAKDRERRLTVCASAGEGNKRKTEPRSARSERYPMILPSMIHVIHMTTNPRVRRL